MKISTEIENLRTAWSDRVAWLEHQNNSVNLTQARVLATCIGELYDIQKSAEEMETHFPTPG